MSKIFTFKIDQEGKEKEIGFRFNMFSLGEACRIEGNVTMNELFYRLGLGEHEETKQKRETDIVTLTNFFFVAAVNYNKGKKLDVDFTPTDVSDWIEWIGYDKGLNMLSEALKSPETKNQVAPESQPGL